jgi:hypothetical protein
MPQRFRKALTLFEDYREMMADDIRLDAYRRAIADVVREGDVVVDLGAGLGLLGFLALKAGAARVYAIEKGDALGLARRVAADNGLADRVVFVDAHSLDAELPEPADVLLSETLGSFGFEENTLGFSIDARDRLLRGGGRMIPRRLESFLAPVTAPEEHARRSFWRDVGGLDFSAALDESLSRMSLMDVRPKQLLAEAQRFADVDLHTVTSASLAQKLVFPITRAGTCHGVAGWFRAELSEGVVLDTAPGQPTTHWRQAFFPYREPVTLSARDHMELRFALTPKDARSDDTDVHYEYRATQLAKEASSVGRNQSCPCGSGKKHKRCCGA